MKDGLIQEGEYLFPFSFSFLFLFVDGEMIVCVRKWWVLWRTQDIGGVYSSGSSLELFD